MFPQDKSALSNLRTAVARILPSASRSILKKIFLSTRRRLLFLCFPNGKYIVSVNKSKIFCSSADPNCDWYLDNNMFLQQEHTAFIKLFSLRQPEVVLDVGAHWGIFPAMLDVKDSPQYPLQCLSIECDPQVWLLYAKHSLLFITLKLLSVITQLEMCAPPLQVIEVVELACKRTAVTTMRRQISL